MSREASEIAISREFARQGQLNKHIILSLISLQATHSACLKLLERLAKDAYGDEFAIDEKKIDEIISDLRWERGKYSFGDLITAIDDESWTQDVRDLFKMYLPLIGIGE